MLRKVRHLFKQLFRLNADLSDFNKEIFYVSTDNGVDLYVTTYTNRIDIAGLKVININLYFYDGSLITLYFLLDECKGRFDQVRKILEMKIQRKGKKIQREHTAAYKWDNSREVLVILIDKDDDNKIKLYHSLLEYSVY